MILKSSFYHKWLHVVHDLALNNARVDYRDDKMTEDLQEHEDPPSIHAPMLFSSGARE